MIQTYYGHVPNQDTSTIPRAVANCAWEETSTQDYGMFGDGLRYIAFIEPQVQWEKAMRVPRLLRQRCLMESKNLCASRN